MPCLFAVLGAIFPRVGAVLIWIARPELFSAAFNNRWLIPILGVVFLPFTTLLYVIMWAPGWSGGGTGLQGFDWLWLVLAAIVDISHWAGTGYTNREHIPGYTGD